MSDGKRAFYLFLLGCLVLFSSIGFTVECLKKDECSVITIGGALYVMLCSTMLCKASIFEETVEDKLLKSKFWLGCLFLLIFVITLKSGIEVLYAGYYTNGEVTGMRKIQLFRSLINNINDNFGYIGVFFIFTTLALLNAYLARVLMKKKI